MKHLNRSMFLLLTVVSCAITWRLFGYVINYNLLMSKMQATRLNAHDKLKIAKSCNHQSVNQTLAEIDQHQKLLAVIFTTFSRNPQKTNIFNNTIKNWSSFLPDIQPVLFTTDPNNSLNIMAESNGWLLVPCPRVNDYGTPYLKDMYRKAYKLHNASYYAFANGDILFDLGLMNTLASIRNNAIYLNKTIVTGRRWNHDVNATFAVWKPQEVSQLAKPGISSLFHTYAEDYFFVTKDYPWNEIKDVVIGRPGYDNYLIGRSIQMNISTIDATNTVSAVHQTGHDGNQAGFKYKDANINKQIIGPFNYESGYSDRVWLRSQFDYKNEVYLEKNKINTYFLLIYQKAFKGT